MANCERCTMPKENMLACADALCPTFGIYSHQTPVQGEALPVVAWVSYARDKVCRIWFGDEPSARTWANEQKLKIEPLTDHAQATAEIARLQGEVERLKEKLNEKH